MDVMLTDVLVVERGSSLLADAAVGATVLVVDDPTDFGDSAEDEGVLEVAGLRYDYAGVDPDAGAITLVAPLTVAVLAGDPVWVVAGDQVATDWVAMCDGGEGEDTKASLPFPFRALLPEGHYDPPAPVTISNEPNPEVIAADGRRPVISQESVSVPLARLNLESNITIPNNVWTNPAWWWFRELSDPEGRYFYYDGTISQMQIWRPGTYLIAATAIFTANSTGVRGIRLRRKHWYDTASPAISEVMLPAVSGQRTTMQISHALACEGGDSIWVEVMQSSGADLAITGVPGNAFTTSWSFVRLG